MWFLIEYDRPSGILVRLDEFREHERSLAEETRLSLEIELNKKKLTHEVVILQAKDEAALRKTHRRYFETLEELVAG
jgi:hypothetical protein